MATRIAEALRGRGIAQLDSPVSGGVAGAEKGTLAVMVSGPRAEYERLAPVLAVFGKPFFIGERPGLAQTMKLANNLLSATALAATSEAVVMGVKAGLDPHLMIDVINAGSGRSTASEAKFPRSILPRTFDFGFTAGLMLKDLRLCMEEAEALGVPAEILRVVRNWFELAVSENGPEKDMTTVIQCIERRAGVEVAGAQAKI
jgi:3-hydroxyisobutyrate dehydrogenase-like beta-hydroxyacid dehydrogenase